MRGCGHRQRGGTDHLPAGRGGGAGTQVASGAKLQRLAAQTAAAAVARVRIERLLARQLPDAVLATLALALLPPPPDGPLDVVVLPGGLEREGQGYEIAGEEDEGRNDDGDLRACETAGSTAGLLALGEAGLVDLRVQQLVEFAQRGGEMTLLHEPPQPGAAAASLRALVTAAGLLGWPHVMPIALAPVDGTQQPPDAPIAASASTGVRQLRGGRPGVRTLVLRQAEYLPSAYRGMLHNDCESPRACCCCRFSAPTRAGPVARGRVPAHRRPRRQSRTRRKTRRARRQLWWAGRQPTNRVGRQLGWAGRQVQAYTREVPSLLHRRVVSSRDRWRRSRLPPST